MRRFLAIFVALLFCSPVLSAAQKPSLDGFWWSGVSPSFKLGWVSGYAKAMDLAGTLSISTCALNLPLYQKEYPSVDAKQIMQKMCLSNTEFDYDGIAMGQFVDGMDAFYRDYRNKQLEVGWAIQYVRDEIKGKSAPELQSEVSLWRRCAAAEQTGNTDQIAKACTPDNTTPSK